MPKPSSVDDKPSTIVTRATVPDEPDVLPGTLHLSFPYLAWVPDERQAVLDGRFTADELDAIAQHMRTHGHG